MDLLELEAGVSRVLHEQAIRATSALLHPDGKRIEAGTKASGGVRLHRFPDLSGCVRPALCSAIASSASSSRASDDAANDRSHSSSPKTSFRMASANASCSVSGSLEASRKARSRALVITTPPSVM